MRAVRRVAVGGLAVCLLVATGCESELAGTGGYAEAGLPTPGPSTAGPASTPATSTASGTSGPPSSPTRTATPRPAPSTTVPGTIPAAFAGTWTGPMRQPTGVITSWTAVIVLRTGTRSGVFNASPYCRGTYVVLAASKIRLVLREVTTSDPSNRCAASGTVTLGKTSATRARARWVDSDHADNTATGILTRS